MNSINKISGRKKRSFYLYNTVSEAYIRESNNIGKVNIINTKNAIFRSIDFNLPNILYIATLTERKCHLDLLEAIHNNNNLFNVNLIGLPTDKKILDYIRDKKSLSGNDINSNINYFPKLSQKTLLFAILFFCLYIYLNE